MGKFGVVDGRAFLALQDEFARDEPADDLQIRRRVLSADTGESFGPVFGEVVGNGRQEQVGQLVLGPLRPTGRIAALAGHERTAALFRRCRFSGRHRNRQCGGRRVVGNTHG